MRKLRRRYRRWRAARRPIAAADWSAALASSRYAARLGRGDQRRLRELATEFLLDKRFTGAHGLAVTPAMCARIAVHACLPVLELGLDAYAGWRGIVVYPGDFRVRRSYQDEAGVVHEGLDELCGESLSQGPMVLSWDALERERDAPDLDLVIHECAHKLDIANGAADGFPPLRPGMDAGAWTAAWQGAYDALCTALERGAQPRIDRYAATDAAEFFAVLSETFFTAPHWVRDDYPRVYAQLAALYRQDPARLLPDDA
jgi:hypothetical protein